MNQFILKSFLSIALLLTLLPQKSSADNDDYSTKLAQFMRTKVAVMRDFYDALEKEIQTNRALQNAHVSADQVVFMGGFARQLAKLLDERGFDKDILFSDIVDPSRDLDVFLNHGSDIPDQTLEKARGHILGILTRVLASHNASVRNVELKLRNDKVRDLLILTQGYDTPSQAFIGPAGAGDIMDILQAYRSPQYSAIDDLRTRTLHYVLPEILESDEEFLNQLIEVFRIFKIRFENPKFTVDAESDDNIKKVLASFRDRNSSLQVYFSGKAGRSSYFKNRIADVLGWVMTKAKETPAAWFDQYNNDYSIWKFFEQFPEIKSQTALDTVNIKISGSVSNPGLEKSPLIKSPGLISLPYSMSFDLTKKQLQRPSSAGKSWSLFSKGKSGGGGLSSIPVASRSGGTASEAISGNSGPVDPQLLPLAAFEVIKVMEFSHHGIDSGAPQFISLIKHPQSQYSTLTIVNAQNGSEMLFLNGRSFQSTSQAGARAGQTGAPMISIIEFDIDGSTIYAMTSDRRLRSMIWTGSSFQINDTGIQAPRGKVKSIVYDKGQLYTLFENGQLTRSSTGGTNETLETSGAVALYKNDSGRVAFIVKSQQPKVKVFVKDSGADSFSEMTIDLSQHPIDAIKTKHGVIPVGDLLSTFASAATSGKQKATAFHEQSTSAIIDYSNDLLSQLESLDTNGIHTFMSGLFEPTKAPTTITDKDGSKGVVTYIEEALTNALTSSPAPAPQLTDIVSELIAVRLILELRRGISIDFGNIPNSFVLGRLIKFLEDHPDWLHSKVSEKLSPLQNDSNYADILQRDDSTATRWKDGVAPNWSTFIFGAIRRLDLKSCAQKVAMFSPSSPKAQ